MSIKEQILSILNNNVGTLVSGEELSSRLGVTRNSVWKAVNSLRHQGYDISSYSSQGYVLNNMADIFSSEEVKKHLKFPADIIIYDESPSSNNIAKEMADSGASEGTVVAVKSQTNGKGRMGRSFISKSDGGLYFTLILRPKIAPDKALDITVLTAVAVCDAIKETSGKDAQIKWVNDVFINDKKCAGILCEAQFSFEMGLLDYVVVGVGINVVPPKDGFDSEISNIATSIFEKEAPCGYKALLLGTVINNIFKLYHDIEKRAYIDSYRKNSNLIGKEVDVYVGNEIITGAVSDIDENARLIVNTKDGVRAFSSGEARVRSKGISL